MRRKAQFEAALQSGDVARALVVAPFGYTSWFRDGAFLFTIDRGGRATAPTLLEAVRQAYENGGVPPETSEGPDNG